MGKTSFLSQILKDKIPESSEIELHLFDFCNLRCQFCGQDHEDKGGYKTIRDKVQPVNEFISKNSHKKHIVNIMGGEIFNDEVPDEMFEEFFYLAQQIHQHAVREGHFCTFNWVTNLIYKKSHRVLSLLARLRHEGIHTNISTSYDLHGRKNNWWKDELFRKNLELFAGSVYTIGFVLTKPTIDFLLHERDEYFEYLYTRYPLYFDFYVPEKTAKYLMPSDDEMLKAFLFLAEKFPGISPVREMLNNQENKMTCYSLNKLTLLPNGREVKCRYLTYKEGDFRSPVDYSSNENIILAHLEENQCLSCPWFQRCTFRCFVQADWAQRQKSQECLFKTFFDTTVKEKNGIDHQAHRSLQL